MANLKSSKKDIKRISIRTLRNKARLSEIKTLSKKLKAHVASKNVQEAAVVFKLVQSKIARAKGKGVLKANTASRRISKLSRHLAGLSVNS